MPVAPGNDSLLPPRYAICTTSWNWCQLRDFFHALCSGNATENYFPLRKSQCIDAHAKVVLLIALEINLNWNALMGKSSRCLKNMFTRTKLSHRVAWIRHRASFRAINHDHTAAKHPPGKTSRAVNKYGGRAVAVLGF